MSETKNQTNSESLRNFMVAAATIVMTIASTFLAFTVPVIWSMSSQLGDVKGAIGEMNGLVTSNSMALTRLEKTTNNTETQLGKIVLRITQTETDPIKLLARSGLQVDENVAAAFVNDRLVVFPLSKSALVFFESQGYSKIQVQPTIAGFVPASLGKSDAPFLGSPVK